ncbi:DUF5805 domain-containing protein [Halobium palmae]|uniref:DUF5805 domain-containing protein n=1 Tax=Halobium palmae TaxID=1776492 RepID=A0ABD5RXK8_9EURY
MGSEVDTSRAEVSTYVPAYQKEAWQRHAEELNMSQSEFVRTMVQAGRSKLDPLGTGEGSDSVDPSTTPDASPGSTENAGSSASADGTGDVREVVLEILETNEYLSWDEVLELVVDDFENQLEETLAELQDENLVRYSGRKGGYTLTAEGSR